MRTRNRPDKPVYICCYHKAGTVLLSKVFKAICAEFGWRIGKVFGKPTHIPTDADVVFFPHSLVDLSGINTPYVGAHIIRDPRDVIVSGYLYHKRCMEEWCLNSNFDQNQPILYPRVPYSQEYRSEDWKRQYLKSLGGKSYQQNLLDLSETDGLFFEMFHYGAWTIKSMLDWDYGNRHVIELRFETLISNFDETLKNLFEHLGFSDDQINQALRIAAKQDINRMSDNELQDNPHISARQTTKWQKYLKDEHKNAFRQQFGDALVQLGYESSDQMVDPKIVPCHGSKLDFLEFRIRIINNRITSI